MPKKMKLCYNWGGALCILSFLSGSYPASILLRNNHDNQLRNMIQLNLIQVASKHQCFLLPLKFYVHVINHII